MGDTHTHTHTHTHTYVYMYACMCRTVLNGSKDGEGFMLLHIAAYFGHLQLAKNLIAMGSRV
jgi:ankyrin repeat protein